MNGLQTLPSSGIVRAVRRREYPVKTPISIVFFAFTIFKSMAISCAASGDVPKCALYKILYVECYILRLRVREREKANREITW